MIDEIVEETRRAREAYVARFGYDLEAISIRPDRSPRPVRSDERATGGVVAAQAATANTGSQAQGIRGKRLTSH